MGNGRELSNPRSEGKPGKRHYEGGGAGKPSDLRQGSFPKKLEMKAEDQNASTVSISDVNGRMRKLEEERKARLGAKIPPSNLQQRLAQIRKEYQSDSDTSSESG